MSGGETECFRGVEKKTSAEKILQNRNQDQQKKGRKMRVFLLLTSALVCVAAGFLGLFRNYGRDWFGEVDRTDKNVAGLNREETLACLKQWMEAVERNLPEKALFYAALVVPEQEKWDPPSRGEMTLFLANGIPSGILNSRFDRTDFLRWRSIAEAQTITEHIRDDREMLLAMRDHPSLAMEIAFQNHYRVLLLESLSKENGEVREQYYELSRAGKTMNIPLGRLKNWNGEEGLSVTDVSEGGQYRVRLVYPCPLNDFKRVNKLLYSRAEPLRNLILADFPEDPAEGFLKAVETHPWVQESAITIVK